MKLGIIGATGHINYVLDGIKEDEDIEIAGLAPGSEGEEIDGLYQRLTKLDNDVRKFDDYRQLLDEIKPDVAVVDCYFGDLAQVTREVLQRNIHAFVEKPMAITFADLKELKEIYQRSQSELAAMLGLRYAPWFLTAWKAVQAGAIGKARLMNAQKSYRLGQRGQHYQKRELYGGTIPWVGIHAIDWLAWFSGEEFRSVYASHSQEYNRDHGDLEVTGLCHFTFSNEVFGSVNIDYLRPEEAPSHGDDRIRVAGTEGVIEVRDNKVFLINDEISGVRELPLTANREIFADFLAHIRGEGECLLSAEDSFRAAEASLKARQSADENHVIEF